MGFSKEWDNYYSSNYGDLWPWSDLISYFNRVHKVLPKNSKVLELGFGTGANIPFFLSKKINYYGIEGSENAVKKAKKSFPNLKSRLICGDFTKNFNLPNKKFDLIFDRASVSHNNSQNINNTVKLIHKILNKNGIYIGIDWFGDEHKEFNNGKFIDDTSTKIYHDNDYFGGYGKIHFVNKEILKDYFNDFFEFIYLEKKEKTNLFNNKKLVFYDFILKSK